MIDFNKILNRIWESSNPLVVKPEEIRISDSVVTVSVIMEEIDFELFDIKYCLN